MERHIGSFGRGNAHWYDMGGGGPLLHFYHANAYPFGTYRWFLQELVGQFHVFGLAHRATWEGAGVPPSRMGWMHYAEDLIAFLEATGMAPAIGTGHSLGAVATMLAAGKRPDLFRALVLIDPVFLDTWFWLSVRATPPPLRRGWSQLIAKTLTRPDRFRSLEEGVAFHRSKRAFRQFPEEVLLDFGVHGLVAMGNGDYRLAYPREWEAHIYGTPPYVWRHLRSIRVPVLAIRGAWSDTLSQAAWRKWQRKRPGDTFVELAQTGHLVPLEAPKQTAKVMVDWLDTLFC